MCDIKYYEYQQRHSVNLHAQRSQATVIARLDCLVRLPSLAQFTRGKLIFWRKYVVFGMMGGDMDSFSLLVLDYFQFTYYVTYKCTVY